MLLQRYASMPANKEIEEGRLTWLVYIIGAVIGGRVSFASTDEHDNLDGELVVRVLQLMSLGTPFVSEKLCPSIRSSFFFCSGYTWNVYCWYGYV